MKRVIPCALLSLLLLSAAGAKAQKQKQAEPCPGAQTQYEMDECAHKEFVAADAELNRVYSQLAAKLDDAEQRAQLKTAELAWIKFRDENCTFEGLFYKGGTMRPMIESFCKADVTRKRTAQLREQLKTYDQ
ncbi:MAG: lysozyme inhibitor LprI family protein [Acidobacteriota bacterium]|nr:lysozyme inhibitor LprI family protein [Acidobacteriota bacterium]MDQ5838919.1 lysozyme inhibitor LprI family protein [Acidobacteriota bacterium]